MSERQSKVITALTILKQSLFKYQGHIGAALVLGGVDDRGPQLFSIYPHGSSDSLPYATMGSGSLAAMAVLESEYHEGLEEDAAKDLVSRAIRAGIFNDLGSGSNVDLCVITKDEARWLRNYHINNSRSREQECRMVLENVGLTRTNTCTATSNPRLLTTLH